MTLELDAEEGLFAEVDPERMAQVIANLFDNAMKFAEATVSISLHPDRASQNGSVPMIQLTIADDGPGFSHEDLPHIFERLFASVPMSAGGDVVST